MGICFTRYPSLSISLKSTNFPLQSVDQGVIFKFYTPFSFIDTFASIQTILNGCFINLYIFRFNKNKSNLESINLGNEPIRKRLLSEVSAASWISTSFSVLDLFQIEIKF